MDKGNDINIYRFLFHDYTGYGKSDPISNIVVKNGCYYFENYCFDFVNDELNCDEQMTICENAFKTLTEVKRVLNQNKGKVIKINSCTKYNSEKSDTDDNGENNSYPYSIDNLNKTVITGKYVGVIKYKNGNTEATIEIGSRFDKENRSQLFLSYLISKTFGISMLPDYQPDTSNENMWDILLCFVFVNQVKEAYKQGLFKEYKLFRYNDPKVKETIDVNRHLKLNMPFMGNIAYNVREHTNDNPILHLVRHTFERLESKYPALVKNIIINDRSEIRLDEIYKSIKYVTLTYNKNDIQKTIQLTNRVISHPFFNKYEPLRKTCRMILRDMGLHIFDSNKNDQVYGVLIDIAWLWEEFVGEHILRSRLNFRHIGEKKPLLVSCEGKVVKQREFDFIKDKVMIVDAKYKVKWQNLEWRNVTNDIYQVLSYMFVGGVNKGGVIFPVEDKANDKAKHIGKYRIYTEHKNDDPYFQNYYFYTIPFIIPKTSADKFTIEIEKRIESVIKGDSESISLAEIVDGKK